MYKGNYEISWKKTLMHCQSFRLSPGLLHLTCSIFIQDTAKPIKPALIAEACQVVDVLGVEVRAHIVDRFVALEMKEYRKIFRTNDEAGQLDNLSRRYAWFRRLIQNFEIEQGRVFPSDWKVNWHLLAKFAEITRYEYVPLTSTVH